MTVRFRVSASWIRGAACFAALCVTAALWRLCAAIYGGQTRLVLATLYLPLGGVLLWMLARRAEAARARERALVSRLEAEVAARKQLCLAAIESLAYAVEPKISTHLGHFAHVQSYAVATARAMGLDEDALDGIRVAALIHDIGRLGIPDNILSKDGTLTDEELEKVRAYPVLGGRLLGAIPFPWPVVSYVRHHREHFDGSGYPDRLSGEEIPLGARILAVADTYDVLISNRAGRPTLSHEAALMEITQASGTQFDPAVVEAFCSILGEANARIAQEEEGHAVPSAAYEIARAQREVKGLYELACSVGSTLCLSDTLEALARKIRASVQCATCVIFLLEESEEYLSAHAAFGVNHWHFRRSRTRFGTYLTGRAASRGETVQASYLAADVQLRRTTEPWTPLRSTLIAPLIADGQVIGTINLYHVQPDAFQPDDARLMAIIGSVAGRAVQNARLFAQTQETAYTDPLTGLHNARYLRQFLDQELNRARKNHHSVAVLGLDLDRFKPINDTYGHSRGDEILHQVGQVLQAQVRNYDMVARYAGDEFTIVLPETSRSEAEIVALKIQAAMERYANCLIQCDPDFPRLGISIGIAVFPEDAGNMTGLLARADDEMYSDKRERHEMRRAA